MRSHSETGARSQCESSGRKSSPFLKHWECCRSLRWCWTLSHGATSNGVRRARGSRSRARIGCATWPSGRRSFAWTTWPILRRPAASCTVSASCSNRRAEGPDGDAILADAALSPAQHRGLREILAIAVLIDQATTFSPANVTRTDATVRLDPFYSDHDSARPGQPCAAQIRVARESRDQRRHL